MYATQIPRRSTCALVAVLISGAVAASPEAASAQTALSAHTLSLDAGSPSPPAALADLAWLEGRWRGRALGGEVEETWFEARGGAMPGFFRAVRDGQVMFYEAWTLVEIDGSVVLRLKHFNADFSGWEERDQVVAFPLVRLADRAVYFDGLTYVLEDRGRLRSYVVVRDDDGTSSELGFEFERVE